MDDEFVAQRHKRIVLERVALFASLVALGLVLGAVGYRLFVAPETWDPLGVYPEQVIAADQTYEWVSDTETLTIPAIMIGDPLFVTGTKCLDGDDPVTTTGEILWTPVDPRGPGFDGGSGTGERLPGCHTFQFVNDPPETVVAWAEELLAAGETPVMRLGGVETPFRDGTEGEARVWQTEVFAFVAGDN